jgi:hypothetical protein
MLTNLRMIGFETLSDEFGINVVFGCCRVQWIPPGHTKYTVQRFTFWFRVLPRF